MQFSQTRSYAATVAEVFAARCDVDAREQACRASGATSWRVEVLAESDQDCAGVRIEVQRVMPPKVPAIVRSFIGDSIEVTQVENWSPETAGVRQADVQVRISGQPATMTGTSVLCPAAGGCTEETSGEVKVVVPFLGSKIEPEIAKVVLAALALEQQAAEDRLAVRN